MDSNSFLVIGKYSPFHCHSSGRLQLFSNVLNTHPEHILLSTMATGCNRLVRMIFGYIAPTSR